MESQTLWTFLRAMSTALSTPISSSKFHSGDLNIRAEAFVSFTDVRGCTSGLKMAIFFFLVICFQLMERCDILQLKSTYVLFTFVILAFSK